MRVKDSELDASQRACSNLGTVLTGLSMVGQALFGGLLTDHLIEPWALSMPERVTIDLIMCVAAFEGKRRVVQYFNQPGFIALAHKPWSHDVSRFINPTNWTLFGWCNLLLTLNASFVFALLSNVSFNRAAQLLRVFAVPQLSWVADEILTNVIFQLCFSVPSFLSNLLGFPGIHQGGANAVRGWLQSCCYHPSYVALLDRQRRMLLDFKCRWQQGFANLAVMQSASLSDLPTILRSLLPVVNFDPNLDIQVGILSPPETFYEVFDRHLKDIDTISFIRRLQDIKVINKSELRELRPRSGIERVCGRFLHAALMAVAIVGFYNFSSMAKVDVRSQWGNETAQQAALLESVSGGAMWLSMMSMSVLSVPPLTQALLQVVCSRSTQLQRLSSIRNAGYFLVALVVCALGGTPNAYQALILDQESVALGIMAAMAPLLLEIFAFHALLSAAFLNGQSLSPKQRLVDTMDAQFSAALQVDQLVSVQPTTDVVRYRCCNRRSTGIWAAIPENNSPLLSYNSNNGIPSV